MSIKVIEFRTRGLAVLIAFGMLFAASSPCAAQTPAAPAAPAAAKPVIVSGTVPDETTRQAILASARAVYGADRVVDQLGVGSVVAPPNWSAYVQKLVTPDLKQISSGALNIDGNNVNVRGEVTNEAQRQQLVSDFAMRLNPTYVIKNGLRVGAGEQQLLDKTLANRIVEFESGSSKLAPLGAQLLDEMANAILKVGKTSHWHNRPHRQQRPPRCQPGIVTVTRGVRTSLPDQQRARCRLARSARHGRQRAYCRQHHGGWSRA